MRLKQAAMKNLLTANIKSSLTVQIKNLRFLKNLYNGHGKIWIR